MTVNIVRVATPVSRYHFDSLKHGDAIEVVSKPGAQEMFRRWKKAKGRRGRLVPSREFPNLLFFIDETII
jgi:hypothetical protein